MIYLYFDSNNVLRETIQTKSFIQGSTNVDGIAVYSELFEDDDFTLDDIWYTQQLPDDTKTNEVSFIDNLQEGVIPYNAKADYKYFKDYTTYKFYVFEFSTEYLSQQGLNIGTIRLSYDDSIVALGEITFNVGTGVVKDDNYITQSQYDYLLLAYASRTLNATAGADLETLLDDKVEAKVESQVEEVFDPFKEKVNARLDNQDETISNLGQLQPSGVDTEANILAKTSADGIWIGTDTGHWYYWNGTQYADGGVYLSSALDDNLDKDSNNSVENGKITTAFIDSLKQTFPCSEFTLSSENLINGYVNANGTFTSSEENTWAVTDYLNVKAGDIIFYKLVAHININCVAFYDINGAFISGIKADATSETIPLFGQIVVPTNATSVRFSFVKYTTWAYYQEQYVYLFNDKSINLLDYKTIDDFSDWELGWINNLGQVVTPSSGWKYSPFYEISNGDFISGVSYLFVNKSVSVYVIPICFYDENYNFISHPFNLDNVATNFSQEVGFNATAPSNAKYFRLSKREISEFSCSIKKNTISLINSLVPTDELKRKIEVNGEWKSGWVYSNGTIHGYGSTGWKYSPFIAVKEGEVINLSTFYYIDNSTPEYAVGLTTYDENYNFVNAPSFDTSETSGQKNVNYTVQSGVKYVRFTTKTNTVFFASITVNSLQNVYDYIHEDDEKKPYIYHFKEIPYNYKKINVIGDSITQGASTTGAEYDNGYVAILRKMLNIEFGGKLNYGFVSAYRQMTPGQIEYMWETPIMNYIGQSGWTRTWNGTDGYGNDEFKTSSTSSNYQMSLNKTFNYIKLAYIKGYNGVIGVYQGDTLLLSVDTSNETKEPALSNAIDISSYPVGTVFSVKMISGSESAFTGFELGMNEDWVTFNNYGRAGIGVQNVTGTLLDNETDCDLLIYALGTNNDVADLSTILNNIKNTIKEKPCDKLVLSTCNKAIRTTDNEVINKTDNIAFLELFANNIGGDFISSYDFLPKSETDNTIVLSNVMQPDGLHPNDKGHALIAEAVAKKLSLSTLSKELEELIFDKFNLHY